MSAGIQEVYRSMMRAAVADSKSRTTLVGYSKDPIESLQKIDASPFEGDWYNNVSTLRAFLNEAVDPVDELARLNFITAARYEAGYKRNQQIGKLVYYGGKWSSDSCGNMLRSLHPIDPELLQVCPKVMSESEYWELAKIVSPDLRLESGIDGVLPAGLCCAECGDAWDIDTAHEHQSQRRSVDFPLDEFVGTEIGVAAEQIAESRAQTQIWRIQSDCMYQNDKYRGLSEEEQQRLGLSVSDGGWVRGDQRKHIIEPGDIAYFNVWEFRHNSCAVKHNESEASDYFLDLLSSVGWDTDQLQQDGKFEIVENQYSQNPVTSWPWFTLSLPEAQITVGWRTRVISITVSSDNNLNLSELFANEDVTKGRTFIHAHGKENAIAYLTTIKNSLEE